MPDTSSVIDVLTRARALVERGWTRGCNAKSAKGERVTVLDPRAYRFCAVGAIARAEGVNVYDLISRPGGALHTLKRVVGAVPAWNDAKKSKAPILAAFDAAIELAKKEAE